MARAAIIALLCSIFLGINALPISPPATAELGKTSSATVHHRWTYRVKGIPEFGMGSAYKDQHFAVINKDTFALVRPLRAKQCGELMVCSPKTGKIESATMIPQPVGFKPKYAFESYFDDAGLWASPQGELFFRWSLAGNGDHGLGFLPRGSNAFATTRSNLALTSSSKLLVAPDGRWYLLRWGPGWPFDYVREVYQIGAEKGLVVELLGKHQGLGHHHIGTLDACFVSGDVIRFICAEVLSWTNNHLRIVTVDFNVREKTWGIKKTLFRQDRFTSHAQPSIVQLSDGSIHYLWEISPGQAKVTEHYGLFYRPHRRDNAVRLAPSVDGYKVVEVGNRLVVCYTLPEAPHLVYFRVIEDGTVGPPTTVAIDDRRIAKHHLGGEYIFLAPAGDNRVWLVNTLDITNFYELVIPATD